VFLVRAGAIATPPVSEGILAGVTRDLVLELARKGGVPLTERPIADAEVAGAEEIFTSGSVSGLRAIASVDGRPVGAQVPARCSERFATPTPPLSLPRPVRPDGRAVRARPEMTSQRPETAASAPGGSAAGARRTLKETRG